MHAIFKFVNFYCNMLSEKSVPLQSIGDTSTAVLCQVSTNSEGLAETGHDRSLSDTSGKSTACSYIFSFVGINKFAEN
jgi:hypothetical protein